MTDDINKKVINIFSASKEEANIPEEEKIQTCQDGFPFVCLKADKNGKPFNSDKIIQSAHECEYIVKVLVQKLKNHHIYNYKVSGKHLLDFLKSYFNDGKEGTIIEIDRYYPEDLA